MDGEKLLTAAEAAKQGSDYLSQEIRSRVATRPFAFDMYAQVAEASDAIDDPSIAWPATRRRVALGRLTIDRVAANTPEQDRALAFNPLNLVDGIAPADPIGGAQAFRGHAYPISVKERRGDGDPTGAAAAPRTGRPIPTSAARPRRAPRRSHLAGRFASRRGGPRASRRVAAPAIAS